MDSHGPHNVKVPVCMWSWPSSLSHEDVSSTVSQDARHPWEIKDSVYDWLTEKPTLSCASFISLSFPLRYLLLNIGVVVFCHLHLMKRATSWKHAFICFNAQYSLIRSLEIYLTMPTFFCLNIWPVWTKKRDQNSKCVGQSLRKGAKCLFVFIITCVIFLDLPFISQWYLPNWKKHIEEKAGKI